MAWRDTFKKYLIQDAKMQAWYTAKLAMLLRADHIDQDEHDEITALVNAHFGV